jgi:hypothetical protein
MSKFLKLYVTALTDNYKQNEKLNYLINFSSIIPALIKVHFANITCFICSNNPNFQILISPNRTIIRR